MNNNITVNELKDRHLGKIGTPTRDAYEESVELEFEAILRERTLGVPTQQIKCKVCVCEKPDIVKEFIPTDYCFICNKIIETPLTPKPNNEQQMCSGIKEILKAFGKLQYEINLLDIDEETLTGVTMRMENLVNNIRKQYGTESSRVFTISDIGKKFIIKANLSNHMFKIGENVTLIKIHGDLDTYSFAGKYYPEMENDLWCCGYDEVERLSKI